MKKSKLILCYLCVGVLLMQSCAILKKPILNPEPNIPKQYAGSRDSTQTELLSWRTYFTDPNLVALIDTALSNNRELQILKQEIAIANLEVKAKKGEYLPFVNYGSAMGIDHSGKYTFNGMSEEDLKTSKDDHPRYIGDFNLGASFSWELDIWKKLRNARAAAVERYLASSEGKNFAVTLLVAEIASSYYELLTLDNQLRIIQQNIEVQSNALQMVKLQKEAARTTQLAINRFEAQLYHTTNLQFEIKQKITEAENRINFLAGRYPGKIIRTSIENLATLPTIIQEGIPIQLLQQRADIRMAEHQLDAAKLDIAVAKASFYPNIRLSANLGLQAFNPAVWLKPESIVAGLFGDMVGPLVNQNALRANFMATHAKQIQAVNAYEQSILKAVNEVQNQLAGIDNYAKSVEVKSKEVQILTQSVSISDNLFKSARADYIEVLLTQREVLESKMELTEIQLYQLKSRVNLYKALGGGWQ